MEWIERHANFRIYSALLLFVMAVAYEYQVWQMGIYYDDWEGIFLYKQGFSATQIWNYFLSDRPFSSFLHVIFNPIIGSSTIGWHILALLLNWGAIVFVVKTILQLWPTRILEAGWIGLLLGAYPGMQTQFLAHVSIPHYTSMFLFFLSVYLMVKAIDGHKYRHIMLYSSVILAAAQVLLIEYFAGLELIRPFIIFFAFRRTGKTNTQALKSSLVAYIPFGMVFAGFLLYKFKILAMLQLNGEAPKYQSNVLKGLNGLTHNPLATLLHYIQIVLQDTIHAMLYAWTLPISLQEINLQSKSYLFSWLVGGIVALISAIFVRGWHQRTNPEKQETFNLRSAALLCGITLLLGGLPIWIVDRQAIQGLWGDRFLFGQIFGAVPLVVIIIIWLTGQERKNIQHIVFAILLAGAISLQMRTSNKYALTWNLERDYYWQLKWRVPSLKEGTFILSPYTPFDKNSGYQIAFATNIIYNPAKGQENVPLWWFDGPDAIIDQATQQYLQHNIKEEFRSLTFRSDMTHALPILYKGGRGCLQVLDPIYTDEPLLFKEESLLFPTFNPGLVTTEEHPMPTDVFGAEPHHNWCYTYQRADLAREFKQWDQVVRLWKEARQKKLQSRYGPEYLPFIEAFAQLGDWETAGQITLKSFETTKDMGPLLCRNWERIQQNTPDSPGKRSAKELIQATLTCQP